MDLDEQSFTSSSSTKEKFHELVAKFCLIRRLRKDDDNRDTNVLIDQLNSFRLDASSVTQKDVNAFIEHCCLVITPELNQLGVKCCLFICYLITKSEAELTDDVLGKVISFLQLFLVKFDNWAFPDILKTLGSVLYGRGGRLSLQHLDELLTPKTGLLYMIVFDPSSEALSRKGALQCIENLCIKSTPYLEDYYASHCLGIFLSVLKTRFPKTDEFLQCKLLCTALRGIHEVTSNTKSAHGSVLGEILAALKAYNFYGRNDVSVEIPARLHPSHLAADVPPSLINPSPPPRPQKKTTKKKTKPKKLKADVLDSDEDGAGDGADTPSNNSSGIVDALPWRGLSGSESDFSDTESSGATSRLQSLQTRVRHQSLLALGSVVKATMRKLIFGFWTSFLPTSSDGKSGTLTAVLGNESSSRVKIAALAAIGAFLDKSKSALLVATERETSSSTPFTPFSVLLGDMIRELHNTLLNHLLSEQCSLTITQTIKCLASVISNSPYQKLRPGLLSRSVKLVRPYLSHKDANIRVVALTCMGSVVTVHAPLLEVSHILLPPTRQENGSEYDSAMSAGEDNSKSLPSTPPVMSHIPSKHTSNSSVSRVNVIWLIKTCGRCVHSSTPGVALQLPIRLEALQVLSSLVVGYLTIVRSSLPYLTNILTQALADKDPAVQLHGAKTSESVACAMSKHLHPQSVSVGAESIPTPSGLVSSDAETFSLEEALQFWDCLLAGPLVDALQNESHVQIRANCCDCLASIGAEVFEAMETSKQIICITMLLALTADPAPFVRASATRALGVYVLFPCQRADVSFMADAANAVIGCMNDENWNVRAKSSWSMANVTDALVLNLSLDDFDAFSSFFSDILLLKLYEVASEACNGDDKVRYNGVRALGNLLRYTQPRTLEKRNMTAIIENSVKVLVQNLNQGTMKVRWNACYALGSLLQNDYITVSSATWLALQTALQRSKYGSDELFSAVWKYVIEAMDESANTQDFTDYKYISLLSHQLCMTVLHLTSLIEVGDLLCLGAVLFSKEDTIKRFLKTSTHQLDRMESLVHLSKLKAAAPDAEKASVIKTLLSIMSLPDLEGELEKPSKTTFRPSYD